MIWVLGTFLIIVGLVLSSFLDNGHNQKKFSVKIKNRLHLFAAILMIVGSVLVLRYVYLSNTVQLTNVDKTGTHFELEIQK